MNWAFKVINLKFYKHFDPFSNNTVHTVLINRVDDTDSTLDSSSNLYIYMRVFQYIGSI